MGNWILRGVVSVFITPWTIRYVIRYFSFNMLRRRPPMHVEGFNVHALEGAIHIARSISFVAVAVICIDKTNIFLTSPAICIVLTIRWSMSKAIHIAVQYIAMLCASMHITPINMSEDPCAIHIVYSICCPIVGATHIDSDQYDCLQYLQYVLSY